MPKYRVLGAFTIFTDSAPMKFSKGVSVTLFEHQARWHCHSRHGLITIPAELIGTKLVLATAGRCANRK